ncbi:MAG: hypothetical protein H6734_27445 [Alphaproteobacteria bacterium]|nr:hypothetical protein [Alphaproteobacteria bacterium]
MRYLLSTWILLGACSGGGALGGGPSLHLIDDGAPGIVSASAVAPDGALIVVGFDDGQLWRYDEASDWWDRVPFSGDRVQAFREDPIHGLLLQTASGVGAFDGETATCCLADAPIRVIGTTGDGRLWGNERDTEDAANNYPVKLAWWSVDQAAWVPEGPALNEANDFDTAMVALPDGRLYQAAPGGLVRVDPGGSPTLVNDCYVRAWQNCQTMPTSPVMDEDGRIRWLTQDKHLYLHDPSDDSFVEHSPLPDLLGAEAVRGLAMDRRGWTLTAGNTDYDSSNAFLYGLSPNGDSWQILEEELTANLTIVHTAHRREVYATAAYFGSWGVWKLD